jgi:hypothetical protein
MPDAGMLTFPDYAPDITAVGLNFSSVASNVVPRADGYGPFQMLAELTQSLPSACRGCIFARKTDGTILVFAATATNLYLLNNTTFAWTNVSKGGGPYASLISTDNWQFAQFNNLVIAVQQNVKPQKIDITTPIVFSDLSADANMPQASHIAIINQFVVLSGLLGNGNRVQWSGFGDPTSATAWTPGVNQSDFQDLPDGGSVHDVRGGDQYGIIFQDQSIRTLIYAPGSPVVFDILRISTQDGIYGQYSSITAGDKVFFYSPQGFKVIESGGYPKPIGKQKVDSTFFADLDVNNLQLFQAATDPMSTRVYWSYKSKSGSAGLADKVLIYDWALGDNGRWSTVIGQSIELMTYLAKPGLTLEALDAIAPGIITISAAANNGAGAIRLTVSGLSAGTPPSNTDLTVENRIEIYNATGGVPAGNFAFTIFNSTHIDLVGGPAFTVTGTGSIGGSLDQLAFSLDTISAEATVRLAAFDSSHALGFFSGPNLEAIIETSAQDLNDRVFISFLRPMTDAPGCFGSIGVRKTAQTAVTYTTEQVVNAQGLIPQRIETRYAQARLRVPAAAVWTYAQGMHAPDALTDQGDR